ncbi:MAG: tetratricopeptide repeat protein [Oligoflexales bacterium]|nr:tetratricopeptide repeat protein [Oligoflexales bacterium]
MKKDWRIILALVFLSVLNSNCISFSSSSETKETQEQSKFYNLGNQYAQDGLFREAANSYRNELLINPQNMAALRNLGIVYVKIGDYKKAITYLKKSQKKFRDTYEVNYYLGEAYRAEEMYDDAIYHYRKALEINNNDIKATKALTWSYYKSRKYDEALKITKTLRKNYPNDPQVSIITSRIFLKTGEAQKALAIIRRAEALAKKDVLPLLQSVEGDILIEMKQYNNAQEVYKNALKEEPLLAGALLGLGKCLLMQNINLDQAVTYIERATRIKPQLVEGYYLLGKAYEQTAPQKAKQYYVKFKEQASTDPEFSEQIIQAKQKITSFSDQNQAKE